MAIKRHLNVAFIGHVDKLMNSQGSCIIMDYQVLFCLLCAGAQEVYCHMYIICLCVSVKSYSKHAYFHNMQELVEFECQKWRQKGVNVKYVKYVSKSYKIVALKEGLR